ncbi:MAG: DNA starvation/stationary phase protection protein [Terrimesophilobacter sp.]
MEASARLSDSLQAVLVDLIELHVQGKQAHWNIVGKNFRDLHLQLDVIVDAARVFADQVAERMRSLDAIPDGRSGTVTQTTTLKPLEGGEIDTADAVTSITQRLDATVDTVRGVRDAVEDEDPTSADLLHTIIERLEQLSWMTSAENRTPRKQSSAKRGPTTKSAARRP